MNSSLEEIAEALSHLHDGVIEAFAVDGATLTWTVRIRYLAQRIDPAYEGLIVRLRHARDLVFEPWWDDQDKKTRLTDLNELLGASPCILGAAVEQQRIAILFTAPQTALEYSGGRLSLLADGIELFDASGKRIATSELAALSDAYWEEFAQRSPGSPPGMVN